MCIWIYDEHLFLVMANRVLAGNRSTGGYGLYVSRPGEDVLSAGSDDMLFWTPKDETGSNFVSAGEAQTVPVSGGAGGVAPTVSSSTVVASGNTASLTYQNYASDKVMVWGARSAFGASASLNQNAFKYTNPGATSVTLNNNGTQSQTIKTVTFNLINSSALF